MKTFPNPDERRLNAMAAEIKRRGLKPPKSVVAAHVAKEVMRRGLIVHETFKSFVSAMQPETYRLEHIPKLVDVVDRLLDKALQHVLILAPPRYHKSQIFSRLLPAYYLLRNPARTFALASHADHLALELSEAARENFKRAGGKLAPESAAKRLWQTAHRDKSGRQGEMWATGMGGGVIGRGFHLGGVDDPIHPSHAFSWTRRHAFEVWWENVWLRGRESGAQMFFVMQRLGTEDPIDYLFRREQTHPLHWHVVALDEVHSAEPLGRWSGPKGIPPSCTLEPDWREVGQVLAPSLFSPAEVKARRLEHTSYVVAAQRQQRPMSATGDFWQAAWFRDYEELPEKAYNGAYDWDTAFGGDERNSATAMVYSFRGPAKQDKPDQFDVYVEDVDFRWVEFPALVEWMRTLSGPHHVEQKASGKSVVQQLKAYGLTAHEVPVKGDKLARASGVQPHVSAGRVYVNMRVKEKLLLAEQQGLLRLTAEQLQQGGGGTDLNDAFVQALHRHLGIHQERRPRVRFV